MANYPFLYNLSSPRSYYAPSLSDPRKQPVFWTDQPQIPERSIGQQLGGVLPFAATLGAVAALGYLPVRGGKRVWDRYVQTLRGIEEYFPVKLFRTFQLSHIFSPFETAVREADLFITPDLLGKNAQYAEYLAKVIGEPRGAFTYQRLLQEGVKLKKGKLYWGEGQVALEYASAIRAPETGGVSRIGAAYARRLGIKEGTVPFEKFFQTGDLGYGGIVNPQLGEGFTAQIIGGKTRFQHYGRKLGALGTEQVERFNRLLGLVPKIGKYLGVKKAGGLEMIGRLSFKYGLGLGALTMSYQTFDWAARRSELLDETLFAEGITHGIATAGVKGHILAAEAAKAVGLQDYAKKQEEIAPGSTSFQKLLAFPLMGAAAVGTGFYVTRIAKMTRMQISEKISATIAAGEVASKMEVLPKYLQSIAELLPARLKKLSPMKLGMLAGAGAGLLTTLPFLFGAIIPSTDPDELRRIYSGQQEVPIRKGRFWELGRQPYEGTRIMYYRPHAYALMGMRGREKSIWGEEEDELSPFSKWWKSQFTYELEEKHYRDRPYPLTGLPFEDVPFIGPLLAATVGRLIKPQVYMHRDELTSEKGVRLPQPGFGGRVVTELGQTPGGIPISPNDPTQVIGEQIYRIGTEMIGLTGFLTAAVKEKLTGSQDWFDQQAQWATSSRIASYEREYWEKELGGLAGLSEAWRRLYPHRRHQIPEINPLRNLMPCLLPETEVLMADGSLQRADNIQIGDLLIGKDGQEVKVKNIGKFPCHKIVDIELYGDNFHINRFSPNHPIYTDKHEFKNAMDVKAGDYVAFPVRRYFNHIYVLPKDIFRIIDLKLFQFTDNWVYYGTQTDTGYLHEIAEKYDYDILRIDIETKRKNPKLYDICSYRTRSKRPISYKRINRFWDLGDFYYLLGVFAAEGSECMKGKSIKLAGHVKDKWEKRICEILNKYNVKYSKQLASSGIGQNIIITCPPLLKLLQTLCPGDAHNKHFIPCVIDQKLVSYLDIKYLMQGLIDGDGYYCRTTRKETVNFGIKCGLRTVSKQLAYQFRNLVINTIGIAPALTYSKNGKFMAFHISSSGKHANLLANFLGYMPIEYTPRQNNDKQYHSETHVYIKVKNVTIIEKDCHVIGHHVNSDQTFCTALIATHNTWLPGPGERGPDLLHGDPYAAISHGEIRLPGLGYKERFQELEGIAPGDYPLIHQFKILGDVAPYTDQYKRTLSKIRGKRASKDWSDYEEGIFQLTLTQVKSKKQKKEFQEYKHLSAMGNIGSKQESSELMATINEWKASGEKEPSLFDKFFGGYWELLSHNAETTLDQLTPVSPAAKFTHMRTAIESYERDILYGSDVAFWTHPYTHFIRPFMRSAAHALGWEGVPKATEHSRNLEEYFDILKYVKFSRLSNLANIVGDTAAVKEFETKKDETLFGVNPFTRNYRSLYRSLPRRERDYFSAFEEAGTIEEKQRILEMVPENEKSLYIARWKIVHADQLKKAKKAGILTDEQIEEADAQIEQIYEEAKTEGFPTSKELLAEYLSSKYRGESYADWYRRTKILGNIESIPGPDWVSFHPSVDLEDIKLKLVQAMGEEPIPLNLWPSRARELPYKPFITEEGIEPLLESEKLSRGEIGTRLNELFFVDKMDGDTFLTTVYGDQEEPSIDIEIEEDRTEEVENIMRRFLA